MCKKVLSMMLVLVMALAVNAPMVRADDGSDEVAGLKTQVKELLKRIEALEQSQAKAKEEVEKVKAQAPTTAAAPTVALEKAASKLKIKGRWAAGYYDSQKDGSYRSGSFEAPEAKIQFGFEPDEINKIIMRMSLNNATFTNLDYFYVDSKLSKFLDLPFELNSRLGRMKLDFGEETWSNNPVESVLASNSSANVAGSDEGVQLSGKVKLFMERPIGWATSISNGSSGTGSDTSSAKAFTGKLSYNILDPLYASASYYNSGKMKAAASEVSIAGITARPGSATDWNRQLWEVDLRYDFEKGKTSVPAYCDSKAIIRLAYGQFDDTSSGGGERDGQYGFAEGTYNITKKLYSATRYSIVGLENKGLTASLNGATANKQHRISLGGGYRFTDSTILKLGYDWNDEGGSNITETDNNLLSAILSSQF